MKFSATFVAIASLLTSSLADDGCHGDGPSARSVRTCELNVAAVNIYSNWHKGAPKWANIVDIQTADFAIVKVDHEYYYKEVDVGTRIGIYCRKYDPRNPSTAYCSQKTLGYAKFNYTGATTNSWLWKSCNNLVDLANQLGGNHTKPTVSH